MKLMRRILGKYYDIAFVRLVFELVFVILPAAFLIRTFIFGLYQVPTGSMETTLLVGERFLADKVTYWFRAPARGEIIAFNEPEYNYSSNFFANFWQRYVSWNVSNWTKRVIAIPGDHIVGKVEDGRPTVYLNGQKLDESAYVNKYPLIRVYRSLAHMRYRTGQWWVDKSFEPSIENPLLPAAQQPFYTINTNLIIYSSTGIPALIKWPNTPEYLGADISIDEFDYILGPNQYWVMGDNRRGSADSRIWKILDGKLIHGRIIFRIWSMDSDESWWFIDLFKNPLGFWKKVRWNRCLQWVK